MKKTLLALVATGTLIALSCTKDPVATETFIREDVVGEWTVNQVAYSREMPNPINPSALMQFSGIGTQLYGKINIYDMPDTGNLHVDCVANLNTIQVPVSLISGRTWYLENNDSTLVLDNDSVSYAFKMISGLPTQQIWQTSFMQVPADSSYWADIDLELTLIK